MAAADPDTPPDDLLGGLLGALPGAGDAQRQRYEMLQAGLDLLDQGLTVFDGELRMVAWNQTFLRLLDFPPEMARVGADFESFIRYNAERGEYGAGDPAALTREIVARARTFVPHQTERLRPNGRLLAVRGVPLPHRGFITLYTDITEQRHYEALIERQNAELEERVRTRTRDLEAANERLREAARANQDIAASLKRSEERLRLITDRVPANIGYFDSDKIFRYANRGYSEWFALPVERIVGHSTASVLGPEVWPTVADNVERALSGQQVSYEYSLTRPDDRRVFARSTLVPEFAPDGSVLGCFVLALDVTEQKRTQAALAQAQKMEAIGQLTGGIAHDFNNMLTVVLGNLSVLREDDGRDRRGDEYLDAALHAARRGVELIKRLLAFSRQQPLAPQAVDIGRMVEEMAKLIRRSLPETIALTTWVGEKALLARVDPSQLDSALLNLVLNARDAMPQGGLVRVEAGALPIGAGDIDLAPGDYVSITVSDNGLGMDTATQAKVFEPFFTTKGFGKGSGLGLAMVYGFVKQSGGGIRLSSKPGHGTVVTLLLPALAEAIEEVDPPAAPARPGDGPQALVLLVEDDPEVRRIVRRQLTELGYPVLEAENGQEALAMIESVPAIGAVLTDIVMPGGVDGWEVARRARDQRPEMRVVLMSGYAHGSPGGEHAGEDADLPLLGKPFEKAALARCLQGALT
jgi:PAS domain S-box-containing protein